jgi:DNA-directed RNA polymerase specialized sigma24 family protein
LTRYAREMHSPDPRLREEAARQIWERFSERLAAEVRRRLDPRVLRREGADAVVQSLFASFFGAAPGPAGMPRDRAQLWRLLVHFTVCKVANTAARHRAARRDVRREVLLGDLETDPPRSAALRFELEDRRGRDPSDEAIARMEFTRLLCLLPDDLREVYVLRLQGATNAEIAAAIGRVERTVELKMKTIRALLRPHLEDVLAPCGDGSTAV